MQTHYALVFELETKIKHDKKCKVIYLTWKVPISPALQPITHSTCVRQVKLGGISGTPDHRFAIINGKMFETGDVATVKITGKSVTIHCLEIGEASVSISMDGIDGTRELKLSAN